MGARAGVLAGVRVLGDAGVLAGVRELADTRVRPYSERERSRMRAQLAHR